MLAYYCSRTWYVIPRDFAYYCSKAIAPVKNENKGDSSGREKSRQGSVPNSKQGVI